MKEETRKRRNKDGFTVHTGLKRGERDEDPPITVALVFPSIRSRRKLTPLKRNLQLKRRAGGLAGDICTDDIREDCLTIKEGDCGTQLAKCISVTTESNPVEPLNRICSSVVRADTYLRGIYGILAC